MTPAEQAARIRERHAQFQRQYSPGPDWEPFNQTHQDRGWLLEEVERLTQAIEQARRAEREACAMTALHWYDLPDEITDQAEPHTVEGMIAAAIRARAQESEG